MHYDFSRVQDIESYVSVPEGSYVCRVAEVREALSRDGHPRWGLRLEVAEGEYAGRTAGWDGVTWSERGAQRVKHFLEAVGFDASGEVELQALDLVGLEIRVAFETEEREDPVTGRRTVRLRVPYHGYAPVEDGVGTVERAGADGLPASSNGEDSP